MQVQGAALAHMNGNLGKNQNSENIETYFYGDYISDLQGHAVRSANWCL